MSASLCKITCDAKLISQAGCLTTLYLKLLCGTDILRILGCIFHDPNNKTHAGQDFPVESRIPIYTTLEGQVVFAGKDGPYGNLVAVENAEYQVWFAHQEKFNVQVADIVQLGDGLGW